jgi:hypothetical protein
VVPYVCANGIIAKNELLFREFSFEEQAQRESFFRYHLASVDDRPQSARACDRAVAIRFKEKSKIGCGLTAQTTSDAAVELGKQVAGTAEVDGKFPNHEEEFGNCSGRMPAAATYLADDDENGVLMPPMQVDRLMEVAVAMLNR